MALPPSTGAKALVTTGSPVRVILKLALPTVLAMLTQSAVNEVDIIFFSRLPCPESSTAQAALEFPRDDLKAKSPALERRARSREEPIRSRKAPRNDEYQFL